MRQIHPVEMRHVPKDISRSVEYDVVTQVEMSQRDLNRPEVLLLYYPNFVVGHVQIFYVGMIVHS